MKSQRVTHRCGTGNTPYVDIVDSELIIGVV